MECTEVRVDTRIKNPEEAELGKRNAQLAFELNHTMPMTERYMEILHELFQPDKINFGAYGDTMHHLHFHLVPKYRDGFEWGGVFAMNPARETLSAEEYEKLVEMIRSKL